MADLADCALRITSADTARIQEAHILCGHMLCDWVELSVCAHDEAQAQKKSAAFAPSLSV
jgi:D-sedoheptulose 7-phosphate isomerase